MDTQAAGRMGAPPYLSRAGPLVSELIEQTALAGGIRSLTPRRDTHPRHDRGHVMLGGLRRDAETPGDLGVAEPLDEQCKDLRLPLCQSRRAGTCLGNRSAGNGAHTARAQLATQSRRCRCSACFVEERERLALARLIAPRQRDRLLVEATQFGPRRSRLTPGPGEVRTVGSSQPAGDLPGHRRRFTECGQPKGRIGQIP